VGWEYLPSAAGKLPPEAARDYDGLLLLGPRVTAATLAGAGRLKVVARFGVGYDNVDVPACTAAGVLLTITPDGVRRPVAVAAMTFILALSHKLLVKDRLTRAGRWAEKLNHNGQGLTGRTLGVIGFGNIGRELVGLARPFDLRVIASDPWADQQAAAAAGVRLVPLEDLLHESDYVCVCCALTPETRHLLNAGRIAMMKPTAYLVNVARGPIVDQRALTAALQQNRIAGAGLDVFDPEPVAPDDPLLGLDNVILTPHAICWTDECFGLNGRSAARSLLDVAAGRVPKPVVNRDALAHPRLAHLALPEDR
jgi:D-3-phosphoglycerate dehydrogenase